MRATLRTATIALGAVLAMGFTATSRADMGKTAGTWDVSSSGAAIYQVPIWVQPGPRGVNPSLSIRYDSSSGNGTMGVGWSLTGFSSITRCAWTPAEDGASRQVAVDASDRFCLDGNKLRITSGPLSSYGSTGAVYQTQVADFSRITSVGTAGTGPQSFLVHTKDGLILEYGNTADSRIVLSGSTVYSWLLNKVSDRDGNSYVVTYTTDNSIGRVPLNVSWGNTTSGVHQYRATFNYSNKSFLRDYVTAYQGSIALTNRLRLDSISIGYSATGSSYATRRQYVLTYAISPTSGQSRLTEIKECAATTANCLKPTTINYQDGAPGVTSSATTAVTANAVLPGRFDFNGDGRTDIAYFNGATWRVGFSTGSGFTSGVDTLMTTTPIAGRFTAQNQDGFLVNVGGNFSYVGFNGVSFTTTPIGVPATSASLTDYNGDGLQDFVWTSTSGTTGRVNVRVNTTAGAATVPSFSSTVNQALSVSLGNSPGGGIVLMGITSCPTDRLCDLNGDGAGDLLVNVTTMNCTGGPGGCSVGVSGYDLISNFGGGYTLQNGTPSAVAAYVGMRFNDDRCTDTLRLSSGQLRIARCGTSATTNVSLPATPLTVIDWDNDGNEDLVVNNGGTLGIYRSNGTTTTPFQALTTTSIPVTCGVFAYFQTDFDGDGLNELACATSTSINYFTRNGGGSVGAPGGTAVFATQVPDLVNNITDGYGISISPSYVSTAQSNYTKGTGTSLPLVDATTPKIVVGRMTVSDGVGAAYDLDYSYKGARRHALLDERATPGTTPAGNVELEAIIGPEGKSAGFEEIVSADSRTGITKKVTFEQLFPLVGTTKATLVSQADGTTISDTTHTNQFALLDSTANNRRYFVHRTQSATDEHEVGGTLNGTLITTTVRTFGYADFTYGNLTTETTVITDKDTTSVPSQANNSWTTAVTRSYDPPLTSGTDWCVGLMNQMQTTKSSTAPGVNAVTRTVAFAADSAAPAKCRVKVVTVEPSSAQYRVTATYGFDSFGNPNSEQLVGRTPLAGGGFGDMPARVTITDWGTTGQTPVSVTDPSGAVRSYAYNPEDGTLKDEFDPNSTPSNVIKKSYQYDGFARKTRETRPDGTYSSWSYDDCGSTGCVYGFHKLTIKQSDYDAAGALITDEFTYKDAYERTLVTRKRRLGGTSWDGVYHWNEVQYDALGRVYKQYMPCTTASAASSCSSNATTNSYDLTGRLTQTSRPRSEADSTPQLTSYFYTGRSQAAVDPLGKVNTRVSNVDGSMRQVRDANNFAVSFTSDAAGTLVGVTDSQAVTRLSGVTVHYGLMPFQVEGTDSALGHYTRVFNSLGEQIAGTDAKGQTFNATYDDLSRLRSYLQPEATTTWEYGTSAAANNIGQLRYRQSVANGETYAETLTYDSRARLQRRTISIPGQGTFDYDIAYDPQTGLPDTLTYPISTSGYRLSLRYGYQNGVLKTVSDANVPATIFWSAGATNAWGHVTQETFGSNFQTSKVFDAVTAQLSSIQSGTSGNPTSIQNLSYLYDLVGNVTQRQNLKVGLTESFYYGGPNDNLYRLGYSTLSDGSSTVTNLEVGYDPSGNIVSKNEAGLDPPLVNQNITWTSYNYPAQITTGSETATFSYGPDRERWRMVYTSGSGTETTYYVGDYMEKVVNGSITTYRHTIMGATGAAAIYSRSSSGTQTVRFALRDRQGSSDAFVDAATSAVTNASFSAFGSRRNATTWSGDPPNRAALDEITRQGFTYHTVLGSMGLNHMNGRVQDSHTGRFISADPFVTDPGFTQNFNRYSYVYNNPVSNIDPSGFDVICFYIPVPTSVTTETTVLVENEETGEYEEQASGSTDRGYNYHFELHCEDIGDIPKGPPDGPGGTPRGNPGGGGGGDDDDDDDDDEDEYETEIFVSEPCGNEGGFVNWFENAARFANENSASNPLDPGSLSAGALLNAADQGRQAFSAARGVNWRLGFANTATRFYAARMAVTAWYVGSRIGSAAVGAAKAWGCTKSK